MTHSQEARPQAGLLDMERFGWASRLLDLVFPPRCAGCGKVDTVWCSACQHEIDLIPAPPVVTLAGDSSLEALATTGPHDGRLRAAIHSLKYEHCPQLALPLGDRLYRHLKAMNRSFDIVVPVPLHTERLRERGYNQSQLLCERIVSLHDIPLVPDALVRSIATRSQVGLNAQQRRENMSQAFRATPHLVKDKSILLIDDVCTSGATLEACAAALRAAGAARVAGLTITRA